MQTTPLMKKNRNSTPCWMQLRYRTPPLSSCLQTLTLGKEWLYDEGEDASKNQYIAKLEELLAIGGPIRQRLLDAQEKARQEQIQLHEEREAEERRIREEAEAKKKAQEAADAAAKKALDEVNKPAEGEKMQVDDASKDEEMTDADTAVDS